MKFILVIDQTYLKHLFIYEYGIQCYPAPPLSSPPVNFEESWSLKNISKKNYVKTMP